MKKILLFSLLMVIGATMAYGADCNGFPDAFYGNLEVNAADASVGSVIRATIDDSPASDEYTTSIEGLYGSSSGDDKLYVTCEQAFQIIEFELYVDGDWVKSDVTATCGCGALHITNLTFLTTGDLDQDGYSIGEDCNDNDASIYPGAPEVCNDVDDDCDGLVDEDFTEEGCSFVCTDSGFVWDDSACCGNDALEATPYQEVELSCDDGNDNDCDGLIDGNDPDCQLGCVDDDQDGFFAIAPECPAGDDCDDTDVTVNPDEAEVCNGIDDNCDDTVDETGDALCDDGLFCNGVEVCNGLSGCGDGTDVDCSPFDHDAISVCDLDDNPFTLDTADAFNSICDETTDSCTTDDVSSVCDIDTCGATCIDEYDCDATDCSDNDGCYDGTYREYNPVLSVCSDCECALGVCDSYNEIVTDLDGDGFDVECDNDCDDTDADRFPGNPEVVDGKDNDCDGQVDEGVGDCVIDDDCDSGYECKEGLCEIKDPVCELFYPVFLYEGWNMIGFPSCDTMAVEDALASIDGNYVEVFSLVDGEWLNYNPAVPEELNTLDTIQPLQGLYIKMDTNDILIIE